MSRSQSLLEALSHAPHNTALLQLYGYNCMEELRLDEALQIFDRILEIDPDHTEAQLSAGRVLLLQGEPSAAAIRAEHLLQQDAENAAAHLLLSRIFLTEENRNKSLEHFMQAVELNPSLSDPALEADLVRNWGKAALKDFSPTTPDFLEDDDHHENTQDFFDDPFEDPSVAEWRPETFFSPADTERFKVNFSDVGGMEALKEEIRLKIIYPLQHPELYKAYDRKPGGGILLYGPPGCGKSLLLRATAGEVSCNYFAVGIHEVFDPYYGSIERNLHQIFETARQNSPCVLVFDELDSIAMDRRNVRDAQMRNVVNQFLSELDGLRDESHRILVIGSTNAPWQLDPALRRPGRFDQTIFVSPPDYQARREIIRLLARNKPISKLNENTLAELTEGFSGADLGWVFDRAAELTLANAIHAKQTLPISMETLISICTQHTPSTMAWIDGVKQQEPSTYHDPIYSEVRKFMQAASKK